MTSKNKFKIITLNIYHKLFIILCFLAIRVPVSHRMTETEISN